MAIWFKLSKDGKNVLVSKLMVDRKLTEKEFESKAKIMPVEEFLKRLPEKKAEKIIAVITRLKELAEMKATRFGKTSTSNPNTRTTSIFYHLGEKTFTHQVGEEAELFERESAIEYGKEFYGEEFMNEHNIFDKMTSFHFLYFKGDKNSGIEPITKEEYDSIQEEIKNLTSRVSLNKMLEKQSTKK
jgi:hypothetical protein